MWGRLTIYEVLRIWEGHRGPSTALAKQLGMTACQLARQIREARKAAVREDAIDPAFQALEMQSPTDAPTGVEITMSWGGDKVVKFPSVDLLVDFLRKVA